MTLLKVLQRRVRASKDEVTDQEEVGNAVPESEANGRGLNTQDGSSSDASDNTWSGDEDGIEGGEVQDNISDVMILVSSRSHKLITPSQSGVSTTPSERLESIKAISFGALAAIRNSIPLKHKPPSIQSEQLASNDPFPEVEERRAGREDHRTHSRASKHAPAELSSKKAVSRKREVIPVHKISHRDPRFEPLSGPLVPEKLKRNYSFLDTYRASEIVTLKTSLRDTKDPSARENLRKTILSMESQQKARAAKESQQEIMREHRKKEKEAIGKGKQPFYLKKAEQKKLALVKRFEGLGEKKAERVIERRRRKKAGRERKGMPFKRRGGEEVGQEYAPG